MPGKVPLITINIFLPGGISPIFLMASVTRLARNGAAKESVPMGEGSFALPFLKMSKLLMCGLALVNWTFPS